MNDGKPLMGWLRLLLIVMVLLTLTACSGFRHGVYDRVMDAERRGAGLEPALLRVDDFEIALLEGSGRGERPTLVLVHGLGASKEVWLRFSRQLKDDFHVIAIDLPGHGDSSKIMDKDYGRSSQVSYLRAVLAEMAVDSPHLAGNSMGGAIITLYAARYPDETASITLFNPAGVYDHESEFMQRLARGENPLIVKERRDFERMLDFSMEKKPFIPWPITRVMAEKAVSNRPINEKIFSDARRDAADSFEEVLTATRVPALIVWGRHDRLIHWENGRVFDALIPDSRLVILDDVGHAPMVEVPEASAALMADFVRSISE